MPTSDAYNKTDRLHQIQLLFWNNPGKRLRTSEIAVKLEVSEDTALRYLTELSSTGRLPVNKDGWYWQLAQDAKFELLPMKLNLSEGTALYLAARLLTQIHDEGNEHVLSALSTGYHKFFPRLTGSTREDTLGGGGEIKCVVLNPVIRLT